RGAEGEGQPFGAVRAEEGDGRPLARPRGAEPGRGPAALGGELAPGAPHRHLAVRCVRQRLALRKARDGRVEQRGEGLHQPPKRCRRRPVSTLLAALRGSTATNSMRRGFLKPASRAWAKAASAPGSGATPGRGTTTAVTCSPHLGCGVPITATSATSGCARSTSSTSAGDTF